MLIRQWRIKKKAIKMIEKLLTSYREKLCAQEIMLVTNLYNASNDIKAAELLADRLSVKGYGLALKRASPVDVEYVNDEIIKYDIADMINKSVKYINSYSFEIRDELISFYKKNKSMEQNKFISGLKNILGLNSDYQLKKAVKSKSAVKVRKPKKPSLLGKLRKYEKIIQEGLRQ